MLAVRLLAYLLWIPALFAVIAAVILPVVSSGLSRPVGGHGWTGVRDQPGGRRRLGSRGRPGGGGGQNRRPHGRLGRVT